MKTKYLKITTFILAGLFCFGSFSASADKHAKRYKKRFSAVKKLSPSALANMKIKNIEFGFNKSTVPENAQENLDKVVKLMADNNASLKLGGYADNKGAYVY